MVKLDFKNRRSNYMMTTGDTQIQIHKGDCKLKDRNAIPCKTGTTETWSAYTNIRQNRFKKKKAPRSLKHVYLCSD